jgi:CTP synthase
VSCSVFSRRSQGLYGKSTISERHRHRYEYNSEFVDILQNAGLKLWYKSRYGLVEIVEIEDHPYWCIPSRIQKSTVSQTHTHFFVNFVAAAVKAGKIT